MPQNKTVKKPDIIQELRMADDVATVVQRYDGFMALAGDNMPANYYREMYAKFSEALKTSVADRTGGIYFQTHKSKKYDN